MVHIQYNFYVKYIKIIAFSAIFLGYFIFTQYTYAATLSVSPSTGVYKSGQTFTANVTVNTAGSPVNAADGTLSFNPNELSVIGIAKGSIFNLWTADPSYSNTTGSITFSGGSPTGYTGASGSVISITFKAKGAGSPKVSFSKGSVLAADGRGTNVLTTMNGGAFTISANEVAAIPEVIEYVAPANTPAAPVIQSSTHPDVTKWYTSKTALLSWQLGTGITAVRTSLDTSAQTIPTKVYDTPIKDITLSDLSEGIQYLHIQLKNADGWGKVAHYKLAIDSQKPEKFDISLAPGNDISNPEQTLKLTTLDVTSKVKRFLVQIDGKEAYEYIDTKGSSTIKLPVLQPGRHTTIIEAFDEAGNSSIATFSFDIFAFDKPQFIEYPKEINEQVIPVIKGKTKPHAKVLVSLEQLGVGISKAYAKKTQEVVSDDTGEFIFIPDGKLSVGVYELTAIATDQYGASSEVSDPVRIAVQQPGYIKIGSLLVSFLSVLIPLLSLLVLLVLGSWYLFFKLRVFKKGVTKETKEVSTVLMNEFAHLQEELAQQKVTLENSRATKKLTKAELAVFDTITAALVVSRNRVEKEVEDVEQLVD